MNITEWIKENLLKKPTKYWSHILKLNNSKIKLIYEESSIFPDTYNKINARIYWIIHKCNIHCPVCGNIKNFINFNQGFGETCSKKCSHKIKHEKYKQTCLEKYGVEHPMQLSETKEKIKQTCLNKYNTDNASKATEIKEKIKKTNNERYNTNTPLQNKEIFEKYKQTILDRYNTDNIAKSEQSKQKYKQTCLERYHVDNTNKLNSTKQKIKQTLLKKYGENFYKENRKKSLKYIKNKNYETFCLNLNKKQLSLISTKDEFINNNSFKFKCLICNNEFESSGTNYQDVTCSCQKSKSYKEYEIYNWLISLNINVIQSDRTQIYPLELDLYLPDYKLAIEFNGLYWHSDLFKNKDYHLNKTNLCSEKRNSINTYIWKRMIK